MRIDANVKVLSSVSHIGESIGIEAEFHRIKIITPQGEVERIPTITGNSIRGILRDSGTRYMLDLLELPALPLIAFYTLFSGGSLQKTGARTIDLDEARELRKAIPVLSIFGAAVGNHIMPGKLNIGMFIPVAFETAHLLPDGLAVPNLSVYDYMQSESYTRRDDAKNENLLDYVQIPEENDGGTPQQMRYQVETMSAGTNLYWSFALNDLTPLEELAFVSALRYWSQYPALGGKSAVGHGLVEISFSNGWYISPERVELPSLDAYNDYLLVNKQSIQAMLNDI